MNTSRAWRKYGHRVFGASKLPNFINLKMMLNQLKWTFSHPSNLGLWSGMTSPGGGERAEGKKVEWMDVLE
jgi:hypothetical protein